MKAAEAKMVAKQYLSEQANEDHSADVLREVRERASRGFLETNVADWRMTDKTIGILRGLGYTVQSLSGEGWYRVSWD